ncbi:Na+-driven multidrug efflux pump [Breznakia sp. PF5-3]|uniref:MATE family efflux transporter n=1 Tax=unclassified Breznakia TaxID=2623764 RepID=UPI0024077587|nr:MULTISPECIES: MATE family efflux transporter [unclassified Breznakia]MDL2276663.1 MATE family efflux transporter [Breznakia sp. OttesenSCG-928-G09]MDF9825714.1 Na+-driven multidrug efflux pump [Breznakia sp. PM6-1]MDF9836544.1 Na+-driven multidrug efflux pump [Breznakia sp. PF5-3]MDF9838345.1 Na+-driven multidrug efflux pump [Breznakia sp. PFB2-8]MDF9860363.1 Na+-driven multidrug efflux pump [Breznakia sp. PH5-24]
MINETSENPLGIKPIQQLIIKFSIPAVISMLVGALYNIVDQIFIGQGVGLLGNAATNVAFPLTTICTAIALLIGLGSASNFNLALGAGKKERAKRVIGTGVSLMLVSGVVLMLIVFLFLEPLMTIFGSSEKVMPYALTYTSITAIGIPFLIFSTGGGNLVRADGSPVLAMVFVLVGALLNTILDPLFIFVFDMGIAGGAWATVIGQIVSGVLVFVYVLHFKTVKLKRDDFKISSEYSKMIASLGAASCFNQLALMLVQIAMNNVLRHYGSLSVYGSDIPLAVVGVVSKVNIVFMAFAIGIAQGCQPIVSFNYGAKNYERVRNTYRIAVISVTMIATIAFLCFQLFPRQIISIFGNGDELYYKFGTQFLKVYMFFTFLNGIQPVTSNFFTSIGKASRGIFLSLTRQVIFLLPLILLFPMMFGIDGVIYAGPIADGSAVVLAAIFIRKEMKEMIALEDQEKYDNSEVLVNESV